MATQPIKPVNKKNVTDDIFRQLFNQIINGTWPLKSKIPSESELCKMFNVSRISVRAALNRLNALGIIETRQGEGSFIKGTATDIIMNPLIQRIALEPVNMLDIMEYRKIMESGTIGLVVELITPEDLSRLSAIVDDMERHKTNVEVFARDDFSFHVELAKISGNSIIIKVMDILQLILQESIADMVPLVGAENGIYYHRLILEDLKEKDKAKAQITMAKHIDSNIIKLKEILAKKE